MEEQQPSKSDNPIIAKLERARLQNLSLKIYNKVIFKQKTDVLKEIEEYRHKVDEQDILLEENKAMLIKLKQ